MRLALEMLDMFKCKDFLLGVIHYLDEVKTYFLMKDIIFSVITSICTMHRCLSGYLRIYLAILF